LACAWRTWEELNRTLATVARVNPSTVVLLLTSPVGILTRCARQAYPQLRVYGICELPWTTLSDLCASRELAATASYAYIAVNHLGWFSDLHCADRTIVHAAAVHPLKYVRLHDAPADVLAEQRASLPRGRELEAVASSAFAAYEIGTPSAVLSALRRRRTPWYVDAVAPFLRALAGHDTGATFFLSAHNDGYCSIVGDDEIIEMPYVVRGGRLERRNARPWQPADVAATFAQLVNYERLAAAAILGRDVHALAAALRAHPWLQGIGDDDQLVADVIRPPATLCETSLT
jgi:alpha-galactosidase/6-phospho-beta-glucosidase family protein